MKRKTLWLSLFLLMAVAGFASDWAVHFNFNYSSGLSDFFKLSQTTTGTDTRKIRNVLGWGFNLGLNIPVADRVALLPSVAVGFGHQKDEFFPEGDENSAVRKTHYFKIYSGNLNFTYDYLLLRNGWSSYLLSGFSVNSPDGDAAVDFQKSSYIGWQAGVGFRFRQLNNLGFNSLIYYKMLFSDEKISYVGLDVGLFFRF